MRILRRIGLGIWFTFRDFAADRCIDRSAALAYVSLLSLVPLLATAAALYRAFFPVHTDEIVQVITAVLPYSPETVAHTLVEFVDRTSRLSAVGSLIFLAIAFRLFLSIETTFNDIWGIRTRRTPATRVFSFTMLVFWGPVVMGLGSTLKIWMPTTPGVSLMLSVGRVALLLLGLTMVYWLAPHTGVHIRSALAGGVTATIGLQMLRRGFVGYIDRFPEINIIYGSLTLVVIFLVSLFAFWMLVILGAETSYVVENLPALLAEHEGRPSPEASPTLTALGLLVECYRRQHERAPAPTLDKLESTLSVSHAAARRVTDQLLDVDLLAITGAERDAYVPGRDAARLTIASAISDFQAGSPPPLPPGGGDPVRKLAKHLKAGSDARSRVLEGVTFADLLTEDRGDDSPVVTGKE